MAVQAIAGGMIPRQSEARLRALFKRPARRVAGAEITRAPDAASDSATPVLASLWNVAALQRMAGLITRYPRLRLIIGGNSLSIPRPAPDGFAITVMPDRDRYTVAFDVWYGDFDTIESALNYVENALAGHLRLRVDSCGAPCAWAVERRSSDGRWIEDSTLAMPHKLLQGSQATSTYARNDPSFYD